jgi:dethiobiotin synthetase
MKSFFITATGTDIGKTLFTCALVHQLRTHGRTVHALKPVISGFDPASNIQTDTGMLLAALGRTASPESVAALSPWRFSAPLSPDMAAQDEGKAIDFDRLVAFSKERKDTDYLLVEGVGGVMVPLDARHTVLDWMKALGFPVILVTASYLGSLSHTLTAAHAVASAGLVLHAVVISESSASAVLPARMEAVLRRFLPRATLLASIARLDSCPELWKYVPDLTQPLQL